MKESREIPEELEAQLEEPLEQSGEETWVVSARPFLDFQVSVEGVVADRLD